MMDMHTILVLAVVLISVTPNLEFLSENMFLSFFKNLIHFSYFLGINLGYLDNSYSNSNNGGSVNSQDSIWQMKTAAANGVNPQYDLGGYVPESDYPVHQHYLPQREDYRENHNLSPQQFCQQSQNLNGKYIEN